MNTGRKLLTLIALVAFLVILLKIGSNQYPYDSMQLEWGRGRVWGLTPLGTALVTLAIAYIGLFVVLNNDRFLQGALTWLHRRWRRLSLGLVIIAVVSGAVVLSYEIVRQVNRKAERAAWMAKREAARQRWQQMSPQERGSIKFAIQHGAIPDDPEERTKLDEVREFIPQVYEPLTDEEVKSRPRTKLLEPSSFPDQPDSTPKTTPDISERIPSWAESTSVSEPSKVPAGDLNKIVLFDVGVEEEPSFFLRTPNRERSVREFHGRVRNDLSRAVEGVVIKVYVYDRPGGELIETRKFHLYQRPFEPSAPASFSAFESMRHLPEHYFYQLQVDEAQYSR